MCRIASLKDSTIGSGAVVGTLDSQTAVGAARAVIGVLVLTSNQKDVNRMGMHSLCCSTSWGTSWWLVVTQSMVYVSYGVQKSLQ